MLRPKAASDGTLKPERSEPHSSTARGQKADQDASSLLLLPSLPPMLSPLLPLVALPLAALPCAAEAAA